MQDIDFDEIDRAVSSAGSPTPDAGDTSSVPVSVTTPSSDTPTPPSPAARRSSGRFMDVVHPSSDMRSSSVPERSAPREEPKKPEFNLHLNDDREETPSDAASKDWPDPLDFHGFNMEETPAVTEAPVEKAEEPVTPPFEEAKEEPAQPLESPFLAGAKVEKRPLGAFSDSETPAEKPEEPAKPEEELLLEAPEEEPLLEATNPEPEATLEAPVSVEEPAQPVEAEPEPAAEPALVVDEEPVGPTSITQQYKERPSTTDQPTGAIYDTEAYHQPLTHTPKKKSGGLVILWIAALILVGAGAGAAVYFFVLPML